MSTTLREYELTLGHGDASLEGTGPDVVRLPIVFVNAYFVGLPGGAWTLVDTGLPYSSARVRAAAEARFGEGARPEAIVLTHGHFDHAGSAAELADGWDVPIYAHPLELPFLTGRSDYPPQDPTIGGAMSFLSRFFPSSGYDFGDRVRALPEDGSVPGMPGWRWLHTPGHTPGHVSLFRESDRFLLAGDAVATMDLDSWRSQLTRERELDRPPAPFTPDWGAARESVQRLAALAPAHIAAGHGIPVSGAAVDASLRRFAADFPVPAHGRYVGRPARADERGVVFVPPPVPDPLLPQIVLGAAALGTVVALRRLGRKWRTTRTEGRSG